MEEFKKLPRIETKNLNIESVSQDQIELIEQRKLALKSQIEELVYEIKRLTIEIGSLVEDYPGDQSYKSAHDSFAKMISEKSILKNNLEKEYDDCVVQSFIAGSTERSASINSSRIQRMDDNLN